ncbi:hypothetical protein PYCC9005_005329 [Savitreella phatthalungensis]
MSSRDHSPGPFLTIHRRLSTTSSPPSEVILPRRPRHVRGGSITERETSPSPSSVHVPLQACDHTILVPLLHRHDEMRMLLRHNSQLFDRVRARVGTDLWDKCVGLWVWTTREAMDDRTWLAETKRLLPQDVWVGWAECVGCDPRIALAPEPGYRVEEGKEIGVEDVPRGREVEGEEEKAKGFGHRRRESLLDTTIEEE